MKQMHALILDSGPAQLIKVKWKAIHNKYHKISAFTGEKIINMEFSR